SRPCRGNRAERLQWSERHGLRADGVITALSTFARFPVPNLRPFPVEKCLREVLETTPLPENCQVVLDCLPDLPPVLADIDQIRIVFSNLVRNAREAMPQGGQLTLTGQQAGDAVEVAVRDTGGGIPPAQLGRFLGP